MAKRHEKSNQREDTSPCQFSVNNSEFVLKTIEELYSHKRFCDVNLVVGEKKYAAHKLILSSTSEVFQVMFMQANWTENDQNEVPLHEHPECEKVFHLFLQYLYTGELIITHTNVQGILILADKYYVKSLYQLCVKYMHDHVSHAAYYNQLFSWLKYSQCRGEKELIHSCEKFIKSNFEEVANSSDYSNLDCEDMVNILKQDDLVVKNEITLYNLVVKWLDLQRPKEEEYMQYLTCLVMQHIRFPMMKSGVILRLMGSPLVKQNMDFFRVRLEKSMELHHSERIDPDWLGDLRNLISPRLYTDISHSILISLGKVELMREFPIDFITENSLVEPFLGIDSWSATFYPRGIAFGCGLLLRVDQQPLQIRPQHLNKIRLKIKCVSLHEPLKFKFTVLIFGRKGEIEHITDVRSEIHHVSVGDTVNIDNILPFSTFQKLGIDNMYLVGPERSTFKLRIIIMPMTRLLSEL